MHFNAADLEELGLKSFQTVLKVNRPDVKRAVLGSTNKLVMVKLDDDNDFILTMWINILPDQLVRCGQTKAGNWVFISQL